jgi:hypothetical protein
MQTNNSYLVPIYGRNLDGKTSIQTIICHAMHAATFVHVKNLFLFICSFQVSKEVEKEKMAAIIARNKLKSMTKAREQEQQQLQVKSVFYLL